MKTFILIAVVIGLILYFLLKKKKIITTTTTTQSPIPTTLAPTTTLTPISNIYYVNNFGDTCAPVSSVPWYGADIYGNPASITYVFKFYDNPGLTGTYLDPGESYSTIGWSDVESDISAKYFGDINNNGEIGSITLCIFK